MTTMKNVDRFDEPERGADMSADTTAAMITANAPADEHSPQTPSAPLEGERNGQVTSRADGKQLCSQQPRQGPSQQVEGRRERIGCVARLPR